MDLANDDRRVSKQISTQEAKTRPGSVQPIEESLGSHRRVPQPPTERFSWTTAIFIKLAAIEALNVLAISSVEYNKHDDSGHPIVNLCLVSTLTPNVPLHMSKR